MIHSYYEEYREELRELEPLDIPDLLILDTREQVQPILKIIHQIPGLEWDDTDVIQTVMQAIQYEHTAMADLQNRCLGIVRTVTGLSAFEGRVFSTRNAKPVAFDPYLHEAFRSGTLHELIGQPGYNAVHNESATLANLLFQLGAYLYATLRILGCYTKGYLYYQFRDWVGFDMRLVRFEPDVESLR